MAHDFNVGDVVKLKGGPMRDGEWGYKISENPHMTVEQVIPNQACCISCIWWGGAMSYQRRTFFPDTLEHVKEVKENE